MKKQLLLTCVYLRSSAVQWNSSDFVDADIHAPVQLVPEEIVRDRRAQERWNRQPPVDQFRFARDAIGAEGRKLVSVADRPTVAGIIEPRVALIARRPLLRL